MAITVRTLTRGDEAPAVDTVVLAFAADPVARWTWPDAHQYLSTMPSLIRAFGGRALAQRGACGTDDYTGVALWLPPGVQPEHETLGEIMQRTVSSSIRDDVFTVFERMAAHHPSGPHWYLPLIGVDSAHQGKGYGAALMTYRRHGFEVLGTIQVGASPPLVPMLRQPRSAPA